MNPATTTAAVSTSTPQGDAPAWHLLTADRVLESLGVSAAAGLDSAEVDRRRATYGPNVLTEAQRRSTFRKLLDQFTDFMVIVLIAAAIVSGILGDPEDTIAIVVIVVLNAVLGFVQEYRAERAVAALKQMAAPTARVRRAGSIHTIAAPELVPGDIVLLEAGNVMPADLRLIEAAQLKV
ncbi:MAG: cation-transporting P-type ATPase, partial [Candidatus Binataceae bacterium]